jgi:tryptophan 2,3-dioxygenase
MSNDAHTNFEKSMSYGDYLKLDDLLASQVPVSEQHDEMLFIVIHQATELWMKLMIHELSAAITSLQQDDLQPAFKMMTRVSRIQSQLIQSWDVLSTLTPSDYLTFRDQLGQSSGFQSYQYRTIEFALGNKQAGMLKPHSHRPDLTEKLTAVFEAPSIYDESLLLLARRGFDVPNDRTNRDWRQPYEPSPGVQAVWREIYQHAGTHWELYELAEKLVDIEDWFRQWRFRHLTTVERIIGGKTGTGGTAGAAYLRRATLEIRLFPELWDVRTDL